MIAITSTIIYKNLGRCRLDTLQCVLLRKWPGCVLDEAIGISTLPPDPAELNGTEGDDHQSEVVHHGVRLASLVHPQPVVNAERLLTLLDQGEFLWDVAPKRIPASISSQILPKVPGGGGEEATEALVDGSRNFFSLF